MSEKKYQTGYMRELRDNWYRCYKIPDDAMWFKPFDIVAVKDWEPIAIELKVSNLKKKITYEQAYNLLRPNQVGSLYKFQEQWWTSIISVWENNFDCKTEFNFILLDKNYGKQID